MRRIAASLLLLCALAATSVVAAPKDRGPQWATLTADQQTALAPLAGEWNRLSLPHKTKWLGIAKRYPAMKPEEQKRARERMQRWAKLTPEQRWQAREQYRNIGKLAPDHRREELRRYWAEYQALPPHEKRMFDVPPTYTPPAVRRQRAAPPKHKPSPVDGLPAPL
ncbi:MAG: DUF3106 domain-containing protein [Betaproteobacteria bacterium]